MTTLLIDGDEVAYKAASIAQENIDWGDGVSVDVRPAEAENYIKNTLEHYRDTLKADTLLVCLGDSANFRKELWPEYKANRNDVARPLLLQQCKDYLAGHWPVECWPRLEGDDVMGILSQEMPDSIIVSVDKDMKTVPCRLFDPNKPEKGVTTITRIDAFINHMFQTLTGDQSDGYKGIPGIGPKKAEAIIRNALPELTKRGSAWDMIIDFEHGKVNVWNAIGYAYEAKGLTSEDAILNARLAYILQSPRDYSRKTSRIRLWRPPT